MAWSPIGYISIIELLEICESASGIISRDLKEMDDAFSAEDDEADDAKIKVWDLQLVIQGKLIENFLHVNANKAVACSPAGDLFKISRVLMRPPIYNHWYSYDERFRKHPDLLYVNIWDGVIDLHGTETRMNQWSDFFDGKEWQDRAIALFSHLDGWSVCFRADEVDISVESIRKLWTPELPVKVASVGRPMIAPDVARRYRARYPHGHEVEGKRWKEIEAEFDVSSKTIRAGLEILAGKNQKEV